MNRETAAGIVAVPNGAGKSDLARKRESGPVVQSIIDPRIHQPEAQFTTPAGRNLAGVFLVPIPKGAASLRTKRMACWMQPGPGFEP